MKVGVSSYSFTRYMQETGADYLKICDLAREMGYDGIEFTELKGEDIDALAASIRAHCQKIGLDIVSYTVGANFLADDLDAQIAQVKRCVDVAALLGAPVMRHDACYGYDEHVHARTWRDAVGAMAPVIRDIAEYAAGKGVKTCTENHGYFIQDSCRMEALMQAVNHPNYGWLIDIGNFACADEDSVHAVNVAAPYVFHVHAKDFLIKPGSAMDPGEGWFKSRGGNYLRGTIVGHGDIPVAQCIGTLKKAGYDGYLSLEFEGPESNLAALKQGHAYLRRFA